ncbi:carbohydrate binding domain-containing protein [Candidatus Binatia bacterium]|nr:carbohydrate binding domain-containing protein [Candidatus Binatia bacterium]
MADAFDLFFDAADGSKFHYRTSASTSGATVLNAEGTLFTLASAPATPFQVGQRTAIYDGFTGLAHCTAKKIPDATHILLQPVQSAADANVILPFQFPNGSAIIVGEEVAAQQVIDLSEAPDDSYDYLVVGHGTLETSGAPAQSDISLRLMALQGDPISGDSGYGTARITLSAASPDRYNFVASTKITLAGGQRYENFIAFAGPQTNGVETYVENPRLLALRVTGGYFAGNGKTAVGNTNLTSYVDYLDLGANLPAGQYLIVCTWALGSTASGAYADAVLEAGSSTVLANQVSATPATTDCIPGGFLGLVTLGATNRVRLRYRSVAGSNANIRNAFLAAVPIGNIPALAGVHASQDLTTDVSQVVTNNSFVTLKTSGAVTLKSGRHIEVVSASLGANAPFRGRPNYGGAGTGLGNHNAAMGTAGSAYVPTFFFVRNRRTAGSTTSSVEGRRNTAVSTTLRARDFTFSWLREQDDFRPRPNERMAVVADIELGGFVLKNWNTTTTTGRFAHRVDATLLSRVLVNASAYPRVYSLAALVNGSWFWDANEMTVYVQLSTTHQAVGSGVPSDPGINVVVVPLLLASRERVVLTDPVSGAYLPYRPLLQSVPGARQTLKANDAKFTTAASLGDLKLVAAHREFDDRLGRPFNGYRVRIRRGYPRKSTKLQDFEVVADAVMGSPRGNQKVLSLRLLDRRRLMQTPIATTRITVKEGTGADLRDRAGQYVPKVWGPVNRLIAYRVTADETSGGWNEYQFCDHAVKSVTAVYLDGTTRAKLATGNIDVTATYAGAGKVRVKNVDASGANTTKPPDKVFVDIVGMTSNRTTTGTALQTYGTIARDIVATEGGTAPTRLIEKTFRMIDRAWRWRQVPSVGRRPLPPTVGFIATDKHTVESALSELLAPVGYWFVNHQDRIGLDVPDFDRGNLARNGGFEEELYPWTTADGGTIATTITRKFEGSKSAEISNGSPSPSATARAYETIVLPAGGQYAITLVASLLEGASDAMRIGVVGPSGVETLSDAQVLETGKWKRASLVYETEPGDAGHTELRIYPAYGSTVPTRIAVDAVEVYRVACVLDQVRSTPGNYEFEDQHFYECEVPFGINLQDPDHISKRKVNESEARNLSSALEPEGKFAVPSSGLAELYALAADADSAGGIAAPVPLQYSRQRLVQDFVVLGLDRIPVVGDYAFHQNNPRVPELADGYPIWRIVDVSYDDQNAKVVKLKCRRQVDPIWDRGDIAPDNVPMGAIAPTRDPGAISDYTEVSDLLDQFVAGAKIPSITTQRGDFFHLHPLAHKHPVPPHDHDVDPTTHGLDADGDPPLYWPIDHIDRYGYPSSIGPQSPVDVARGKTDGGHGHPVTSEILHSPLASGESSNPNATLETPPGPNEPSFRRVRFMQRTGNTTNLVSSKLIVGFPSAALPAGWIRLTELDGLYLRGAGTLGPMSTTTTATFAPNDAGSTLSLTSGTDAVVGRRLTVTKSGSTVHVVITVANGATPTVVPLHETSDVANGSFPTGSGATVTADSQLLVRTNVATSTYTPNDAGSTLKVASATNISVGSLLQVINTDDASKYVHVRISAVSGTDLTAIPLHLSGDQPNSYSFPAGTGKLVVDAEYRAPTHKHGGVINPHQHAAGGHPHDAVEFDLGSAIEGLQAQAYRGGSGTNVVLAASRDHPHKVKIPLPGENTNSGFAGGTITDDLEPTPPFKEIVWAVSDGTQTTIPASGMLLWAQGAVAPGGWGILGAAKDLLFKGAPSGQDPSSSSTPHAHTQNNSAHTILHGHGGTTIVDSDGPTDGGVLVDRNAGAGIVSVASGRGGAQGGHAHPVTALIESFDPGLTATSHATGSAVNGMPRHRKLCLIQKL